MTTEQTETIQGFGLIKHRSDCYALTLAEEMLRLVGKRVDPNPTLELTKITFWSHGHEMEFEFDVVKDSRIEVNNGVQEEVTEYTRELVRVKTRWLGDVTPPVPTPSEKREPI